jgi:glycosyltransferase involved in cell wall biosynthesis
LFYISLARFPTEKAHGLQIAQNCEALANNGYEVQLWVSTRHNTPAMKAIPDPFKHYGVDTNFTIERVSSIDLYPFMNGNLFLERIAFYVHVLTFCLVLLLRLTKNNADVYYTRDEFVLLVLSLLVPKEKLAFEAHQFRLSKHGAWLQSLVTKRSHSLIAITAKLRDDFISKRQAKPEQIILAHDGIRAARFENMPSQIEARQQIGWSEDAFIVGFVGRLQMLSNLDKGVGTLIEALAQVEHSYIGLVGGPEDAAEELRQKWLNLGLPAEHFLYVGQVTPDNVPIYLSAFDICAMPHPNNPQFAYYTSPLKLFEYMASERPVIASDLPSWADVIQHDYNALLVPPSNVEALAEAIQRLKDNVTLRERLGKQGRKTVVQHYTWTRRAQTIRNHIERDIMAVENE